MKLSHQETLNLDATVHGLNHSPLIKVQCETHRKLSICGSVHHAFVVK